MTNGRNLTILLAMATAVLAATQPVQSKPLPSDSRVLTGTCANGVKWLYRQHDNPPGKMALMIHIRTGSLNETEAQRGLAHFIEHMCFNGTENFPPGKLIPYFESIGMEFGADLNAFTGFDQTAYMLFTPDTSAEQIDKALMVLSDYAFRAELPMEEIDKERGVVLEESRSGKSAGQRIRDKVWPELFGGSRFARRLPIGEEDVIRGAGREEFVDYYRTWYRPENTTVVLVGDAAVDDIAPMIEKWFGEYHATAPAREAKGPEFTPFTKQRAIVATDPELSRCQVQMLNILPGRPAVTTYEQAREELVEYMGTWIVGRRYDERVNKGVASYRGAGVGVFNFFQDGLLISGSAGGEPQDWEKMLEELIVEVSRAREFGFTERELDLAKKEILSSAERAVKTEPTKNARRMIRQMVSAVNDRTPIMSAAQDLALYQEVMASITLAEVTAALKDHFTPGTFAYIVETPDKEGVVVPTRDEVLATARAAWARKVQPLESEDSPTDLLASMPTAGKIAEKSVDAELGITSVWLANGVRVHHRFMDYKKDSVRVSISLAGGAIEETAGNVGVTQVGGLAVNDAATTRLTSTNFRDILTGKNISVRGGGGGDSFAITVSGSPEDLDIGMQAAHALLMDGKLEESAFKNWKLSTLRRIEAWEKRPQVRAIQAMQDLLTGGDPRRPFLNREEVEALSVEAGQLWFSRLCREAPIEVAVVGDMPFDDVMPLIQKYIGSLPARKRSTEYLDKLRSYARPTGPLAKHVEVDTITPKAMAMAGFIGCEGRNIADRRALQLAANVLTSRLIKRIREELSIVYSIRCTSSPSWIFADSGRFMAGAPCDPGNVDRVVEEILGMFKAFAEEGMTAEELENAKKQIANNLDTSMREPSYWMGILRHHDLHRRDLSEPKTEKEAFQRLTADQVQSVFRKYCTPEREFRVTAAPVQKATPEASEKATAPPS